MPKVGKRKYPYTTEGQKQAKAAAAKSGKPVVNKNEKKR
jgi:hypothetical protein